MSNNPLVSIIINNYNYGGFLREAIDSALAQFYSNTEVIVVDDGSTDHSKMIIAQYGNKIIPVFKDNGGQASAFNDGFNISKGQIIIFLDSDDVLLPTTVEKSIRSFDDPKVVKVHWPLWKVDTNRKKTGKLLPDSVLIDGDLKDELIKNGPTSCGGPPNSPPTTGNAWSRRYLREVFPMPEQPFRQTADYYLMVLAPLYGTIRKLEEPLGLYRVHGSNSTLRQSYLTNFLDRFEYCCVVLSKYLKKTGIDINPAVWPRNHWFHKIDYSLKDIETIVPLDESFILVDGNDWGTGEIVANRKRLLFIESDGKYWGLPADDEHALREIKRQKENGASSIIFAWSAFWMLDYYKDMSSYLEKNYRHIVKNDRLIGFNLANKLI